MALDIDPPDEKHTHLPEINTTNTKIGYQLYEDNSIDAF